jgi:hypothetical protein
MDGKGAGGGVEEEENLLRGGWLKFIPENGSNKVVVLGRGPKTFRTATVQVFITVIRCSNYESRPLALISRQWPLL